MNTITKKVMSILFSAVLVFSAVSALAAESDIMTGKLISVSPEQSMVDVKVDVMGLSGPMTRDVSLDLAADVKWSICLGDSCAEKIGIEGPLMLKEYSAYEAYGLRVEGCDVTMVKSRDAITEIRIDIC